MGPITGGGFVLTTRTAPATAPLVWFATAAQVQAALQGIGINVNCTGGPLPDNTVTMTGPALGPVANIAVLANNLIGPNTPAVVTHHPVVGSLGDPVLITIETGPAGAFPQMVRVNGIELYLTKGVGRALGVNPLETDPDVSIQMSRDGGQNWSNPRIVKIGRQSLTDGRVRSAIWGQAQNQGMRWRLQESAPLPFAFMGLDVQTDTLR